MGWRNQASANSDETARLYMLYNNLGFRVCDSSYLLHNRNYCIICDNVQETFELFP